jgi:2-(1,2-epoxy-1,2-dihydrophenyl)acetyl-CoA isomerase
MEFKYILLKKEGAIATIVLNRPEKLNALNYWAYSELIKALDEVAEDEDVRVLVLTGSGRAFCTGADFRFRDVKEGKFERVGAEAEDMGPGKGKIYSGRLVPIPGQAVIKLYKFDKPTIAMVNGDAVGNGWGLAIACDLRVGSYNARFMNAFGRLGLIPGPGDGWLLMQVVGPSKALEYLLTNDFLNAEEAYRIGVLNKLVPPDDLERETMAFARKIADGPPLMQRFAKLYVQKAIGISDLETAIQFAFLCDSILLRTEDHDEAIRAFAEKRMPIFKGR